MLSRRASGNCRHQFGTEGAANCIAAQRQRQAGHLLPPLAEIDNAVQAGLVVGQLAFVNNQPSFVFSFEHLRDDLVEGNNFGFHSGSEKLQSQVRGGERSGHGNALGLDFARGKGARRDNHRPVALAHTASARHQRVFILNVWIGVEGNRADVIDAFSRLLVQRLDVAEGMGEAQAGGADFVRGQAVKHEGVVGVRAVGHGNLAHLTCDTAARRFCGFGYYGHWKTPEI